MAAAPAQNRSLRARARSSRVAAVCALTLSANVARAEDIHESLSWALRSSFDIKADDQRQVAADARVLGSYEAFLPTISYGFNRPLDSHIRYSPDFSSLSNGDGVIDTIARREANAESLTLSLPLFDGFKRLNDVGAARAAASAGQQIRLEKREQVLLDTASAYLAILRDRSIIEMRRRQLAEVTTVARGVEAKLSVHDATIADSALADSRIDAARAALEQAQSDLAASETELVRLAGPAARPDALPRVPAQLLPTSLSELQQALAAANPKIIASRLNADSADYVAKSAYARFLPQLNFLFSKSKQGAISNYAFNASDTTALLQLRIPLYDPGEVSNLIGERAIARQKGYEALDLERTVLAEATIAFTRRQSTIAQIKDAKRRVARLESAVKAQQVSKTVGLLTIVDLLNTVSELADARIALARLEFARDQTTYALLAALNRLAV